MDARRVRELLDYDPDTGDLTWKVTRAGGCAKGSIAGCEHRSGYRIVKLDYKIRGAHSLAWAHYHGEWPISEIDHINRNRSDNRIDNLRLVTCRENHQNRSDQSRYGVGVVKKGNRFSSRIQLLGKRFELGSYPEPQQASRAYETACQLIKLGIEPDRDRVKRYMKEIK